MKKFIVIMLFVPVLMFVVVVGIIATRVASAPSAFKLESFPMPDIGTEPESDDPKVKEGWKVFTSKGCVYCHGPAGAGGIKNPGAVGGEVPSLTLVAQGYSEEELKERITKGVKADEISTDAGAGPPPLYMPSWKNDLTKKELNDLVHYLFSLAPESEEEDWD